MITSGDVESAATRLQGVAVRTPLVENDALNEIVNGRVLLKLECLQRTGSFKIRGAYNFLSQLSPREARCGVVAWSSGNHAQGVACAARLLGIQAAVVMPDDAPKTKLDSTRRLGGEVIPYDRDTGDREAIARAIAKDRGAIIVPSYDHDRIIAGQGTVGLEIAEQAGAANVQVDQVLICCGGGGLTAGCATILTARLPETRIYTVEPENFDDTARSIEAGQRVSITGDTKSICDALLADRPGELTFEIMRERVTKGLTVSELDICAAMRFAFQQLKLVVEPGAAVALAAAMKRKVQTEDRTTVVVISGGNVDADLFAEIQAEPN